mgnify:CR=1 FL=1
MEEIYNKIIEKVKELATISNEARLKIQVTILVRKALNFMNRDDFPVELIEPFAEHLALKTIEETKALLEHAYKQGVRTIVSTSHRRKGMFETSEKTMVEQF